MPPRSAFTLIELLVVVTIIVILMALLTPALERAITEAQMAVCGANLRTTGWMATTYTQDNRKYFPERKITVRPVNTFNATNDTGASVPVDDRPVLKGWFALNKAFNDPMCETIDVEGSEPTSELELPYNVWWGFKYTYPLSNAGTEEGMFRLYGRFTYTHPGVEKYRFNVLASDLEALNGSGPVSAASGTGTAFSSHPDREGVMALHRLQDAAEPGGNAASTRYTYSKWTNRGTGRSRPPVDFNYVLSDLSVVRLNRVAYDEQSRTGRMINVPWLRSADHNFSFKVHLPRQ